MQIFLLFTFLFAYPLESGHFSEINFSKISPLICRNNIYVSPIDGIVEEIISNKNKFTIKISNDVIEIIFVDLDCVYRNVGDKIIAGDEIGEDNNLTLFTEFVIIQYNNANDFPQFNNNKLHFSGSAQGTPIHSMESGVVSMVNYEEERGNFIEIMSIKESGIILQIQYWHLSSIRVRINDTINKNGVIGYVGNVGLSYEPHLSVLFANMYKDYKAIYMKNKLN
jgi:hypothetical protein